MSATNTKNTPGEPATDPLAAIRLPNALPCPFCGSTRIVKGERYYAMCVDCGATGPERNADATRGKFTADWNSRK
jgi:transcription elongation factor Elf1